MKLIKETKWQKAKDLRGNDILVKTIWEQRKDGKIFTRREAVRQAVRQAS